MENRRPFQPLDDLDQFAVWFSRQGPPCGLIPFDAVSFVGDFAQVVLCRQPPYQVQLGLARPNSEIVEHSHPDVDTILVYLGGEFLLTIDSQPVVSGQETKIMADGRCSLIGQSWRVKPGQLHGAKIGPAGGVFMSIQKWLKGEPRSVELNWAGPPLSEDHARMFSPPY